MLTKPIMKVMITGIVIPGRSLNSSHHRLQVCLHPPASIVNIMPWLPPHICIIALTVTVCYPGQVSSNLSPGQDWIFSPSCLLLVHYLMVGRWVWCNLTAFPGIHAPLLSVACVLLCPCDHATGFYIEYRDYIYNIFCGSLFVSILDDI